MNSQIINSEGFAACFSGKGGGGHRGNLAVRTNLQQLSHHTPHPSLGSGRFREHSTEDQRR